jgi:3-oxoadipate enol-lactonase
VLVIGARHDVSTTVAQAEFLRDHIAKAELIVLDSAHLSNVERSDDFAAAVRGFLGYPSTP